MRADQTTGRGSARTHHSDRRKLRKRLEAEGVPADEIERQVEEMRARQGRQRLPNSPPRPQRSKNYSRKRSLAIRDGEVCHWCDAPLDITIVDPRHPSPPRATLDHVIPRSLGGPSSLNNLVLACEPCNAERGGIHQEGAFSRLVGLPSAKGKRSELA